MKTIINNLLQLQSFINKSSNKPASTKVEDDDCRQDVLALQVISLLKDIFHAVGLDLYMYPYGVLPTDPERGIIEVVPITHSRSQMGETTDGGYEIFQQDFGAVGSPSFEAARHILSSAVLVMLLPACCFSQRKDIMEIIYLISMRKLEQAGNEMVTLANILFEISRSHYDQFVSRKPLATEAHGCQGCGEKQKSESV